MAVHSPLNAFSFDISLIEIGQEIKLLEHLKKIGSPHIFNYVRIKHKQLNNWYSCQTAGN
jgi:hypothetical protein